MQAEMTAPTKEYTVSELWEGIRKGEIEPDLETDGAMYFLHSHTSYSFHVLAVRYDSYKEKSVEEELYYNLRDRDYFIKRNGRNVKFNVDNVDRFVPRPDNSFIFDPESNFSDNEKQQIRINLRRMEITPYVKMENGFILNGWDKFQIMIENEEVKGMYGKCSDILGDMGQERVQMPGRMLCRLLFEYPFLEILYKMGRPIHKIRKPVLNTLKKNTQNIFDEGKKYNLKNIFGLSKANYKFYIQYTNWPTESPVPFQNLEQSERNLVPILRDYFHQLDEQYATDIGERKFEGLDIPAFIIGVNDARQDVEAGTPIDFREPYRSRLGQLYYWTIHPESIYTNYKKLIEYVYYETYFSQGMDVSDAIRHLQDYNDMGHNMRIAARDKYPDSLKKEHDVLARNYKVTVNKEQAEYFKQNVEKYINRKWEKKYGDYQIVIPKEPNDLIHEGSVLSHCVGSYVRNVAKGSTMIVFLREEEDVPNVTVEVRNSTIVQIQGKSGRPLNQKEKDALNKFATSFRLDKKVVI